MASRCFTYWPSVFVSPNSSTSASIKYNTRLGRLHGRQKIRSWLSSNTSSKTVSFSHIFWTSAPIESWRGLAKEPTAGLRVLMHARRWLWHLQRPSRFGLRKGNNPFIRMMHCRLSRRGSEKVTYRMKRHRTSNTFRPFSGHFLALGFQCLWLVAKLRTSNIRLQTAVSQSTLECDM